MIEDIIDTAFGKDAMNCSRSIINYPDRFSFGGAVPLGLHLRRPTTSTVRIEARTADNAVLRRSSRSQSLDVIIIRTEEVNDRSRARRLALFLPPFFETQRLFFQKKFSSTLQCNDAFFVLMQFRYVRTHGAPIAGAHLWKLGFMGKQHDHNQQE